MKKISYIALLLLAFYGCKDPVAEQQPPNITFEVVSFKNEWVAGDEIQLQFTSDKNARPQLWLQSAFGSTLIEPLIAENKIAFMLPESFSEKAGITHWQLIYNKSIALNGAITVIPNFNKKVTLESYLGPKSITAGGTDFSMLVVAPTDIYDNLLLDSTAIDVVHQFDSNISENTAIIKNGIAWKNIYSTEKAGRILISAVHKNESSTEMTTDVQAAKAKAFTISYLRNHKYADGNQIIEFSTGIIKDEYNNMITDGTLVSFIVKDAKDGVLKTMGTTINGIAKASLLHPDEPDNWLVTAYINGASKSTTIPVVFESAIKDFELVFSSDGRTIQVEKIQSFMHQLVPDGIPVTLEIKNEKGFLLETKQSTSKLGQTEFLLSKEFYPNSNYMISVNASGIVKNKTITLQ